MKKVFRKTDNWRQIYKQTSSIFYTSTDEPRRKNYLYIITRLRNSCLITFSKKCRSSHRRCKSSHRRCSIKNDVFKDFVNLTGKHLCRSLFQIKLQALSLQVFLKIDTNTSAFLWSLWNSQEHLFWRPSENGCF